ncbi:MULTISPECIES: hypothetical protein [Elizabethkingia]|uniref:Uncharacterized protein n=1 Tax=Elizabethkingia meningoseptica TaxID=238 RepID=A0A1T3F5G5_ELIME|nr:MULTISPECIES: hypothetical protein [Elizabethkingia]AQX11483.1 hypothetical protein BBD35_03410 [Elizabethkingia meningoseptica]MBG0512833.1 hypothetical protein [Elizabethkingia meningoseptica]MDE5435435.1 hypothetical protein [Elizabethkingia meningoseptica]MDE5483282.1 hypothetical protein [Elizabethkingia meningoseptica]MDE5538028.1 hypothetical protein [Elizabethkingia meningoseptica]
MTAQEIELIKDQFSDRLHIYDRNKVTGSLYGLTDTDRKILFEIGLPKYQGYGGVYVPMDNLILEDGKYMKIYTREGQENNYNEYINVYNHEVVFKNTIGGNTNYFFINKDLESYLKYLQLYEDFRLNVKIPEKLGSYWGTLEEDGNHEQYAVELKRRFLEVNNDVERSHVWAPLIEEMDLGVI